MLRDGLFSSDEFIKAADESEWMKKITERFNEAAAKWLESVTGEKFGTDRKAWEVWLQEAQNRLVYDRKRGVFKRTGGPGRDDH